MKFKFCLVIAILLVIASISSVLAQFYPQEEILGGNATEDMLVWVTNYEPKLLRSDLLEQSDVPIYAKIQGVQVNPFINIPVITSVSLHPAMIGKNTNVVGLNYIKPAGLATTKDLGWIVVTVKRIPTEDKMPDAIELNVSAAIDYYFEDIIGFGTKDMTLGVVSEKEWRNKEWQYEFWDNSGFLRLTELTTDQRAIIELYDSSKNFIGKLSLAAGQKSNPYLMNINGKRGYVTITLNGIETPSSYARVLVNVNGKKSESIMKNNFPLYAGSEWKVLNIEPKSGGGGNLVIRNSKGEERILSIETRSIKVLENNEEKTRGIGDQLGDSYIGWITDDRVYMIKADNKDRALKDIKDLVKSKGVIAAFDYAKSSGAIKEFTYIPQGGMIPGTSIVIKNITSPTYTAVLDNPEAKKYLDSVLEQYNEIADGLDVSVRNGTSIPLTPTDSGYVKYNASWPKSALWRAYEFTALNGYDQAKSADFLRKLIDKYPYDKDKDMWQEKLDSIFDYNYANAQAFVTDKGAEVSVLLEEISIPDLAAKANLIVHGVQGEYKEGAILDTEWYVEKVTDKDITLRKSDSSRTETIASGSERELNKTTGLTVKVLSTKVEKEARVTVAPYHKNGHTVTNFSLHVAIEKRGIQLSPDQINEQIKYADEQIKQLDKITASMGNTITGLRNTCFATYSYLLVKKLFDWSGTVGKARNIVMNGIDGNSGWIKICEDNITTSKKMGIFKKSVEDCLWDNRKAIDDQLKITEKVLGSVKGDMLNYFDNQGNIKNYTALMKAFPNTDIQSFIKNQEYLKNKFGTSQLTRGDIEQLYFYQQLGGQGKDQAFLEAEGKFNELKSVYSKDNKAIESLQAQIPETSANYDQLKNNPLERQDRLDRWKLASENALIQQPKPAEKVNAFKIEVDVKNPDKGTAYVPSIDSKPISIFKEGENWKYTSSDGKNVTIVRQQECAGKTKVPLLELYGTGKNKGLPARVPFSKGWSEVSDYDSNGNVIQMTIHVTTPLDNGECPDLIYNRGQDLNVFVDADRKVIQGASGCVDSAITSVKTKQQSFVCEGRSYNKGSDYTPRAEQNYCQDFFSESDCNVLYQVCDPVICPASRCDFGGRFKVGNVIQSGIFGSIFLCLPNFPTPFIAVCLPGIRAGLMGYKSMLQGYESCLQKQIQTGETVGICDRIRSLYWCDILWKTVLSIYDSFGGFYGMISGGFDKAKGGGEYLSANTGLQEAEKSLGYFTSIYAEDVFAKFRMLSSEEIGGIVCQRAIYGSIPTSMDLFADLSTPEVPPQFFGHVEESAYTTVDTPKSHYKVYYHIYAGEEKGVYYKVYLSSPIASAFTPTPLMEYPIDAGYLEKSAMLDQSPDFIAPSGYRQLCIDLNGVPYCGFGWVSSEAAVQELTDLYSKKLSSSNIKNENECMFSSPAYVPVVGGALEGTNLLAKRGINRICSSGDPNAGRGTRVWDAVGWCDQKAGIKCWLDTSSVQSAVKDLKIQYDIVNASESVSKLFEAGYQTNEEVIKKLADAYNEYYNKNFNVAINVAGKILQETAPTEATLIDEARFITGLSYESLLSIKVKELKLKEIPAKECPGSKWEIYIKNELNRQGITKWGADDAINLTEAIISLESGGNPAAGSVAGAVGLMQIMPSTAVGVDSTVTAETLKDPQTNLRIGIAYFNKLFNALGSSNDAIVAYLEGYNANTKKLYDDWMTRHDAYNTTGLMYLNSVRSYYYACGQEKKPIEVVVPPTTPAEKTGVYAISYKSSNAETADSLAARFSTDKNKIQQDNGKASFSAGENIKINLNYLEFSNLNSKYDIKNNLGCAQYAGKCDYGLKLTGSGNSYTAEDIECYSPAAGSCAPCSQADDCSDLSPDPLKCASIKCFNQSKISKDSTKYCVYQDSKCQPYGPSQFVSDINNQMQGKSPAEQINLCKQIIESLPNTQYSRDAVNKAIGIAKSSMDYQSLAVYATDEWKKKDLNVYQQAAFAKWKADGLNLGYKLASTYAELFKKCLNNTPTDPKFCRCEVDSNILLNVTILKNSYLYDLILEKMPNRISIRVVDKSNSLVAYDEDIPFNSLCSLTKAFEKAKYFDFINDGQGGLSYFDTISVPMDKMDLATSLHFFNINRNKLCIVTSYNIYSGEYATLSAC